MTIVKGYQRYFVHDGERIYGFATRLEAEAFIGRVAIEKGDAR